MLRRTGIKVRRGLGLVTKRPAGIEGVTATRLLAFALFIALLTFGTGCAESLSTVGPAASVSPPPYLFWPPHGATSIAKLAALSAQLRKSVAGFRLPDYSEGTTTLSTQTVSLPSTKEAVNPQSTQSAQNAARLRKARGGGV